MKKKYSFLLIAILMMTAIQVILAMKSKSLSDWAVSNNPQQTVNYYNFYSIPADTLLSTDSIVGSETDIREATRLGYVRGYIDAVLVYNRHKEDYRRTGLDDVLMNLKDMHIGEIADSLVRIYSDAHVTERNIAIPAYMMCTSIPLARNGQKPFSERYIVDSIPSINSLKSGKETGYAKTK